MRPPAGSRGFPFNAWFHNTRFQALYLAAELRAAGMTRGARVSSVLLRCSQLPRSPQPVSVRIGATFVNSDALTELVATSTVYGPAAHVLGRAAAPEHVYVHDGLRTARDLRHAYAAMYGAPADRVQLFFRDDLLADAAPVPLDAIDVDRAALPQPPPTSGMADLLSVFSSGSDGTKDGAAEREPEAEAEPGDAIGAPLDALAALRVRGATLRTPLDESGAPITLSRQLTAAELAAAGARRSRSQQLADAAGARMLAALADDDLPKLFLRSRRPARAQAAEAQRAVMLDVVDLAAEGAGGVAALYTDGWQRFDFVPMSAWDGARHLVLEVACEVAEPCEGGGVCLHAVPGATRAAYAVATTGTHPTYDGGVLSGSVAGVVPALKLLWNATPPPRPERPTLALLPDTAPVLSCVPPAACSPPALPAASRAGAAA